MPEWTQRRSRRAHSRWPRTTRLYFLLDTLDNLVKGGRAGKATGLAASLLNIKPVLEVNDDGIIEPFKKVRGRPQAIAALASMSLRTQRENGRMRVALLHAARPRTPRSSRTRSSQPAPTSRWSRTA